MQKTFHFARFPYQPSEPWIPGPCDAPKLRRLTGNIHLNGWGSAAVGPQAQQITGCFARPGNFGHHDHGFSEGPWCFVGCSHKSARNSLPSGGCLNFIAWKCEPVSFKTQKILGSSPQIIQILWQGLEFWAWRLSLHQT